MGYGVRQAMQMFMNFCTFMQTQRTKGRLNGLGASMIRPWMHRGFVRVLATSAQEDSRLPRTYHVCPRLDHVLRLPRDSPRVTRYSQRAITLAGGSSLPSPR